MNYTYTQIAIENRMATITLNRPEKRNALNYALVAELKMHLTNLREDPNAKIIRFKSNGEAFSAGADLDYLKQLQSNTYEENLQDSNHLKELFEMIYLYPKIVIAQVEGHAIAGGCGLATVCDFTFATPNAQFGYTEVKIGFIPAIVSIFLLKKVNEKTARELLLTGRLISATEAKSLQLIHDVIEGDQIDQHVAEFAAKINRETSADSIKLTKELFAQLNNLGIQEAFSLAADYNAKARATNDCKRGISAFINKEKITW
jgi:methylglutaconyl-CoA hydratase